MKTRSLHLAYLSLLVVLALTLVMSFPFSLYVFAGAKALIILFVFMHVRHTDEMSHAYLIIAVALLGVAIFGIWDDIGFRGRPYKFPLQESSPRLMEGIVEILGT